YHGTGGTSAGMAATSGFNTLADQDNFIAVYPQGVQIGGDIQWNVYVDDQPGHAGVGDANAPDDILFTRDMIDKLATDYGIDRKRVYASGLSNGAFMCYALSMFAFNEIAAIAPVAGNLWGDSNYLQALLAGGTVTPMPVMHVHGTADNVVDYPDPDNTPKPYEEYPLFVSARGCNATTYSDVVPIMHNVDKLVFCPPPVEVSLIRITGMGHAWTNGEYPTSTAIVKFFNLESGSAAVAAQDKQSGIHLASSIADASIQFALDYPATIQLYNTLGELKFESKQGIGSAEIPTRSFRTGVYILRFTSSFAHTFSEKILVEH
ncbi:MAG: PHB depolymerase family esterase, partial [Bacteroidota bacterium]|nr:PHB depolymerase family esterase [Bacteroidota bacterium]